MLRHPLTFPAKPVISPEAQDLISQLLIKDPAQRLGSKAGAEDIKKHPWFNGINWALLRNQQPPYVPRKAAAAGSSSTPTKMSTESTATGGNVGTNNFDNY